MHCIGKRSFIFLLCFSIIEHSQRATLWCCWSSIAKVMRSWARSFMYCELQNMIFKSSKLQKILKWCFKFNLQKYDKTWFFRVKNIESMIFSRSNPSKMLKTLFSDLNLKMMETDFFRAQTLKNYRNNFKDLKNNKSLCNKSKIFKTRLCY